MRLPIQRQPIKSTRPNRRMRIKPAAVIFLTMLAAAGCGGGGNPPPPPPDGDTSPPVQSNWSPAKNAYVNSNSFSITLQTDEQATCRWSASDLAYGSMATACSGVGTLLHTCAVTGLPEGGVTIYIGCADESGNRDTANTNTQVPYTIDTIAPAINITEPADGELFYFDTPPSSVAVSYSDSSSGVDSATLRVSYTLYGRPIDLTDRLMRDDSSAQTDPVFTEPLYRTSLSRFGSTDFQSPETSWTIDRCGYDYGNLHVVSDGEDRLYAWDTECESIWVIDTSTGEIAKAEADGKILSVAASAASGKFYAAIADTPKLYIYNISSPSLPEEAPLACQPTALSHNPANDRLYIACQSQKYFGRFSCESNVMEAPLIGISVVPEYLAAWPTSDGDILAIGPYFSQYRLFRYAPDGTERWSADIVDQVPISLAVAENHGLAFVSRFTKNDVRAVGVSNGTPTDIGVGNKPRGIFTAGNQAIVINAEDNTISILSAISLTELQTVPESAPAAAGVYLGGKYYLLEDIWQFSSKTITINASVQDRAGNTGQTSIPISVQRESPGL